MLPPNDDERAAIQAELRRLRTKQAEVKDKDIKSALKLSIEVFEEKLAKLPAANEPQAVEIAAEESDPRQLREQLEADIKRLRVKQQAVGDRDMEAALGLQIEAVQAKLAPLIAAEAKEEPEAAPHPPTLEEQDAADKLVQRAQVEKRRGNTKEVSDLLAEASRIAPGSATVLELLGDELSEQHKYPEAIAVYDRARKLDPKNINVDKKHANLVFQAKAAPAGAVLSMADHESMVSNRKRAVLFSVCLPGLGQIVLGEYTKGATYMGIWVGMIVWIFIKMPDALGLLVSVGIHAKGANLQYSMAILIPIITAIILHLTSIWGCQLSGTDIGPMSATTKGKMDRPVPPVNLPFE